MRSFPMSLASSRLQPIRHVQAYKAKLSQSSIRLPWYGCAPSMAYLAAKPCSRTSINTFPRFERFEWREGASAHTQTPTQERERARCDDANQVSALINFHLARPPPPPPPSSSSDVTLHEPFNIWRIPRVTAARRRRPTRRRRRAQAAGRAAPVSLPSSQRELISSNRPLAPSDHPTGGGGTHWGRQASQRSHTFISRCPLAPEHFGRTDGRTELGQLPQSTSTPNTHTN